MQKSQKQKSRNLNQTKRRNNVSFNEESGMVSTQKQNKNKPVVFLPEIISAPIQKTTRRFITASAISGSAITIADLLNQFLVATTSILGVSYLRMVRIKRIRMLCPVTTQGTSIGCKFQPSTVDSGNNSFNSCGEVFADTSASIDIPAYLALEPKLTTPLGSWHYSTTVSTNLLIVSCPPGTTMDIQFEYILNTDNSVSAYTVALSGAVSGTLYSRNILSFVPFSTVSI
jgi:hypothetical protein